MRMADMEAVGMTPRPSSPRPRPLIPVGLLARSAWRPTWAPSAPAVSTSLKNPVTGEPHGAAIVLETGFIGKRGDCGQGSFRVEAEGIELEFNDSNWILYDFDWTNES